MNSELEKIVRTIKNLEGEIKRDYKAKIIGLFGSYVRGEQKERSDVDILVRFFEELIQDDKTSSAVIKKFEIIGEATKHIPGWLTKKHPEVPWKSVAGMRARLTHAYFGIDYKLVWDAIKIELPQLKPKIQKILAQLEKENKKETP